MGLGSGFVESSRENSITDTISAKSFVSAKGESGVTGSSANDSIISEIELGAIATKAVGFKEELGEEIKIKLVFSRSILPYSLDFIESY